MEEIKKLDTAPSQMAVVKKINELVDVANSVVPEPEPEEDTGVIIKRYDDEQQS